MKRKKENQTRKSTNHDTHDKSKFTKQKKIQKIIIVTNRKVSDSWFYNKLKRPMAQKNKKVKDFESDPVLFASLVEAETAGAGADMVARGAAGLIWLGPVLGASVVPLMAN